MARRRPGSCGDMQAMSCGDTGPTAAMQLEQPTTKAAERPPTTSSQVELSRFAIGSELTRTSDSDLTTFLSEQAAQEASARMIQKHMRSHMVRSTLAVMMEMAARMCAAGVAI